MIRTCETKKSTNHIGLERFSNDCRKTNSKVLLQPITTGANSAAKQSEFLAVTCNLLKGREKSRVQGAIGLGFAFHWLKNWRKIFKLITKRNNCNRIINFDSHSKTDISSDNVSRQCNQFWRNSLLLCYEFKW